MAATRATALEYLAAIGGGHALAETMHAHATTDFGLICTFRHFNSSLKGITLLFKYCSLHKSMNFKAANYREELLSKFTSLRSTQ